MRPIKRSPITAWVTCFSLAVSLCAGIMVGDRANAASPHVLLQPTDKSERSAKACYPTLSRYAIDLTKQARQGQLDLVTGHDIEINRTLEILSGDMAHNPVLVGESGSSTSIVAEGLAQRIASGDVPESLRDKRLFSLSLDALAAHTKNSGEFTARLKAVFAEVESSKGRIILFVDQLHQYVGTYAARIASDMLRDSLEHSHLRIVGGTSVEAYAEYIAGDAALSALFQQVHVTAVNGGELSKGQEANENSAQKRNAEGFEGDKISSELRTMMQSASSKGERVSLILQVNDLNSAKLNALLNSNGVRVDGRFQRLGALKIEAPVKLVEQLAASGNTNYISLDQQVQSLGHLSLTTGADAVRRYTTTSTTTSLLGNTITTTNTTSTDGTGIGIAMVDSGIDPGHKAFLGTNEQNRIVYSRDFTGENRTDDPFGHGTHVAAIAAGNGRIAEAKYIGIAPNANIINLRVLNSQGLGTVSRTLSALDWLLANHATYNIRVVNMSLGTPAIDSYTNDPVCRAVRRLVDAGVIVVAAAGNNGKNSAGQKVYGQIHCPGNEPAAITVGASNTFGTNGRNDDGVASFSSRGPTRSGWTDAAGVKHYDNLIKPELVAPGNRIIEAESDHNLLVTQHPELDAGVSAGENRREMFLSGSSMASPGVAGAAALLLQT